MAMASEEIRTDGAIISNYVHPHSVNAGVPTADIPPPQIHGELEIDEAVLQALPVPGTKLRTAYHYGASLWGKIAKLVMELPDGSRCNYFLKIIPFDNPGKQMCRGEFESLKAMHAVVPSFIPVVHQWGFLKKGPGCFLLAEFREVGQQPPDPRKFTMRVAELHRNSQSPNGKFGFHVPTFHGNLPTYTDWEESWTVMFTKILGRAMDLDLQKYGPDKEFNAVRQLLFDKVIPRLLDPLTSHGRTIKPCLVHGDLWDENCAVDMNTGEPFAFDAGSLYAHNEYEIGYWRPPRHRLSNKAYIRSYKRFFPVSEPEDEWDDRNLLYSMRYNIGCAVLIPSSGQHQVVLADMKTLCRKFYPRELSDIECSLNESGMDSVAGEDESELEDDMVNSTPRLGFVMPMRQDRLKEALKSEGELDKYDDKRAAKPEEKETETHRGKELQISDEKVGQTHDTVPTNVQEADNGTVSGSSDIPAVEQVGETVGAKIDGKVDVVEDITLDRMTTLKGHSEEATVAGEQENFGST